MVIVMEPGAAEAQVEAVIAQLNADGFDVHRSSGVDRTVLGAIGVQPDFDTRRLAVLDGVAEVYRVTEPYRFASRAWKRADTVVEAGGVAVGGAGVVVVAGPGAVGDADALAATAAHAAAHGARLLRGGAFAPGPPLGEAALRRLRETADAHGLAVVAEVDEVEALPVVQRYADLLEVAPRNMHRRRLLEALAAAGRPVLLGRGPAATVEEWLLAAEVILKHGNPDVVLCERGIRTFETATHRTLDLAAVPVVKKKSHLPILVDPSRATGRRDYVRPLARAALAAGADGLLIALHPTPAATDGPAALSFDAFAEMMPELRAVAEVVGRRLGDGS